MQVNGITGPISYNPAGQIGYGGGGGCSRGAQIYQDQVVIPQIKAFTADVLKHGVDIYA